jgi:glycosyltransferase involved in cell wall biosynthesis
VNTVHALVPEGIHSPHRPSGGNTYDRRLCRGLTELGWSVHEQAVPGEWPHPDTAALSTLRNALEQIPDLTIVLLDGLIASTVPEVLVPQARRLRLVVLVHMPLGEGSITRTAADSSKRERLVLSSATAVVATSPWTRRWLIDRYALRPDRVHVAEPGVDTAQLARGTLEGGELLCVAAVTPIKGHDVLLAALTTIADLPWRCAFVGALDRDASFVDHLRRQVSQSGISNRVQFSGPLAGADLDAAYAGADALVLASRAESYGMVVAEALARGLPVVTKAVGGLPETLGRAADGSRPGLLVASAASDDFGAALRRWLGDRELRQRCRSAAQERRMTLSGWSQTAVTVSHVLAAVAT